MLHVGSRQGASVPAAAKHGHGQHEGEEEQQPRSREEEQGVEGYFAAGGEAVKLHGGYDTAKHEP